MARLRGLCPSPVVQSLSHVFVTPWTAARQASLSFTLAQSLLKLMSIESVMPSNQLIFCCPLLPPSIFPSIRDFSNESALCIIWSKYWSLSFNISPFNEHSGLISFRMDWLDLLAVQGTFKSLLQSLVQFSRSVVSLRHSLRPHEPEPQHAKPPCPSPTSRVHPNPCALNR